MVNVLVTGNAWFVWSHLSEHLIWKWYNVIWLDDMSGWYERNIVQWVKHYKWSITDKKLVKEIFEKEKIDYVFHCAAWACEGMSHHKKMFVWNNICVGSANLMNQSVNYGIKRFVNFSSMATYGSVEVPYKEDTHKKPEDTYWIAKHAVELDLECTFHKFGLEYTNFLPHNIIWSRQNIADSFRNVVWIFINQTMRWDPMTIFGDWTQIRAFSHISDIVPYIAESINNDKAINQSYNIWGDIPYTINELAETVKKVMGKWEIVHLEPRFEVHTAYSDHSKLKRDFEVYPTKDLEYGVSDMVEYAKIIWPQTPTRIQEIEIMKTMHEKRLPLID